MWLMSNDENDFDFSLFDGTRDFEEQEQETDMQHQMKKHLYREACRFAAPPSGVRFCMLVRPVQSIRTRSSGQSSALVEQHLSMPNFLGDW